jgi:hypothetical protein
MTKMRPKLRNSDFYEETVGRLTKLTRNQEFLIAWISDVDLVLPPEMENKLRPLIGKRIGILRTDIPGKEYLIRVLPDLEKEIESMTAQDLCANEHASNCCEVI